MKYREFPNIKDEKISVLGFGCMRLPHFDNDTSKIDEETATKMVRYAIDNGVNYIDTAYPYHQGESERFVAKALKDGYREKVHLATKHPVWLVEKYEDFEKYLDEQLEKLDVEYIDFYLLHALNSDRWEKMVEHGAIKFLEEARSKGKIKYIGFSFHDELDVFKKIINSYPWDFAQIQLNFMDQEYQAGLEGMKYAAERDIGIIVMEPLRGGSLTNNIPDDIQNIWDSAEINRSPAEWCLRWVGDHPEVITVLSGMSEMSHVTENVKVADEMIANSLTEKEHEIINKVRDVYLNRLQVNCTACEYCLPCPQGINIPKIFSIYNNAYMYNNIERAKKQYQSMIENGIDASVCVNCGQCESECPQAIAIPKRLEEIHKELTE
jgi:predicted aldo/keto reductase-like oxidoreductase